SRAGTAASRTSSGVVRVASRPRTVAGKTAGAATTLAKTATTLTEPDSMATTGAHASWAASGTAIAAATVRGNQRRSASVQLGASARMPAVARTERANPYVRPSHGSRASTLMTATASAGTPDRRVPANTASRPTRPIAAARSTLGSGRARRTKPRVVSTPRTGSRPNGTLDQRAAVSTPAR